jgi:hypothetical protein
MADQNRGGNQDNNTGRRNPADNLTHQDRVRGGEKSAQLQTRDERGQFAGRKKNQDNQSRGGGGGYNSSGNNAGMGSNNNLGANR